MLIFKINNEKDDKFATVDKHLQRLEHLLSEK